MKPYLLVFACSAILIGSCKKDNPAPVNHPPVAHAGTAQAIQLPVDSVTLTGTGSSVDTKIVGYLWSEVSGPNVPVIAQEASPTTLVRGLIAGKYTFQFMVIDSLGLTGVDTVSVTVTASPIVTVSLQPSNNPTEAFVVTEAPNAYAGSPYMLGIYTWTENSATVFGRSYLKFDLSQIPSNATITSATLSLYSMPNSPLGNFVDAQFGSANASYIQRVTSSWSDSSITWNTQPSATTANQATIPQSASSFEDQPNLDVTALVKDMVADGNNGFKIGLQNEAVYNIRQFASSFYTDATKHPKLVVVYSVH